MLLRKSNTFRHETNPVALVATGFYALTIHVTEIADGVLLRRAQTIKPGRSRTGWRFAKRQCIRAEDVGLQWSPALEIGRGFGDYRLSGGPVTSNPNWPFALKGLEMSN